MIIWQNYSINIYERILRSIVFWISAFLFLLFVFWTVTSLEKTGQDIVALTANIKCTANVTEADAFGDYQIADPAERNGSYHCFCSGLATNNGTLFAYNYKFANEYDGSKMLCKGWVRQSNKHAAISMVIPLVIGFINVGVEIIIGFGSEYISRPRNYQ